MSPISEALKKGEDIPICDSCAKTNGGTWPKDHVATFSMGTCGVCGRNDATCALSDWSWPGRKTKLDREF